MYLVPKEVYYDQYCTTCKYKNLDEGDDPCNDCLASPCNYESHKPIYYKEAKNDC